MSEPVLRAAALAKTYLDTGMPVPVLTGVDLAVEPGEQAAVVGASGSGKSTLLHLLAGLDRPSAGEVWWQTHRVDALGTAARDRLRNRLLGFVYQFHHLLPEFTAEENVAMPLLIRGVPTVVATSAAREMLKAVGLGARLRHKPAQLSGGERQRAAVARALVGRPACVLADEPTGNLDRRHAMQVFDLMCALNRELGLALVVVTHDTELAARVSTVYRLVDGRLARA